LGIARCAASALAAAAVIIGIAAGTAGCASGNSSSSSASSDPLASDSIATIINDARANATAAQSVHVAGWVISSGEKESISLTLVRGQGCAGTVTVGGVGTVGLVWIGKTVWLRAPTMPANEYVKTDTSNPQVKNITSECSMSGFLSGVTATGDVAGTRARTTINGKPAVVVTVVNPSDGHNESAYVTDTAEPLLLRLSEASSAGGLLNFTGYGATRSLTPPPSSKVVSAG
jgi:hypothetical protein